MHSYEPTMKKLYSATFVALLVLAGCGNGTGNGGGSVDSTSNPDSMSSDTEAPEIRDVQIEIKGEFSSKVTLTSDEATRVLPVEADAAFTVFASDDTTDSEKLAINAIDDGGEQLSKSSEEFQNGLWKFETRLSPGSTIRVEVTDEAGNSTTNEHALKILSHEEALVSDWEKRFFANDDQSITRTDRLTVKSDGTWNEKVEMYERGGDYRVDMEKLVWQRTYQTGGMDTDSDKSTVETDFAGEYYVDDSFFSPRPWTRQDSGSDAAGTWKRSWKRYKHENGKRTLDAEIEETLKLEKKSNADNTWNYERKTTPKGSGASTSSHTQSGTYETIEITTNYGENYGTFLVRTKTRENGKQLMMSVKTTELYRTPLDKLLISPYTRNSSVED